MQTIAKALLLASAAWAQSQGPKLQVLIITGQNGASHDWRATTPVLRKILEDTGRFEVRVTEEFRGAGPETLAPYDVVVLHYYEKKDAAFRWGDRADTALLNYVRSGKGLVVYHYATAAFDRWPEYEKLCGGNWRPTNGRHSPPHPFEVTIRDTEHPITRGLKLQLSHNTDELYANLKWQPEGSHHVLATAWDDHSLYITANQPVTGKGLDQPMLWTVNYGNGRVFATVLGHDVEAMGSAVFQVTLVRGAEWAATGNVTLPVPPEASK